jgi:hypothetical protein
MTSRRRPGIHGKETDLFLKFLFGTLDSRAWDLPLAPSEPLLSPEVDQHGRADQDHDQPDEPIPHLPLQFWHVFEEEKVYTF